MAEAPTDPSHPAAFWDARYAEPAYAYGEEPNAWLVRQSERLPTEGAALVPSFEREQLPLGAHDPSSTPGSR